MKTPISELPLEAGMVGMFEEPDEIMSRQGVLSAVGSPAYFTDSCGDTWESFTPDPVQTNGFKWDGQNPEGPDWGGRMDVLLRGGNQVDYYQYFNDKFFKDVWTHRGLDIDIVRVFFIPSLTP